MFQRNEAARSLAVFSISNQARDVCFDAVMRFWAGVSIHATLVQDYAGKIASLGIQHSRGAIAYGSDEATALATSAHVIALIEHDATTALRLFDRGLDLSNSNVFALNFSAIILSWMGKPELAIERAQRALRLVLLRHERFRCGHLWIWAAQQGQRDSVLTSATINRRRIVAIEFGIWRSGRKGGTSGSITVEYGRLREQRGGTRSTGGNHFPLGDQESIGCDA